MPENKKIALRPVESSNLSAAGYDPETFTFAAQFANGSIWHYTPVPPGMAAGFWEAASKGKYFGAHIKPLIGKQA